MERQTNQYTRRESNAKTIIWLSNPYPAYPIFQGSGDSAWQVICTPRTLPVFVERGVLQATLQQLICDVMDLKAATAADVLISPFVQSAHPAQNVHDHYTQTLLCRTNTGHVSPANSKSGLIMDDLYLFRSSAVHDTTHLTSFGPGCCYTCFRYHQTHEVQILSA